MKKFKIRFEDSSDFILDAENYAIGQSGFITFYKNTDLMTPNVVFFVNQKSVRYIVEI